MGCSERLFGARGMEDVQQQLVPRMQVSLGCRVWEMGDGGWAKGDRRWEMGDDFGGAPRCYLVQEERRLLREILCQGCRCVDFWGWGVGFGIWEIRDGI